MSKPTNDPPATTSLDVRNYLIKALHWIWWVRGLGTNSTRSAYPVGSDPRIGT